MNIAVYTTNYKELNQMIREYLVEKNNITLTHVYGQRYIGVGIEKGKKITISGTPGNDLGMFISGGEIEVFGNGQDAVGNTMSGGSIIIHGRVSDALGYSMRDGKIFIKEDCGYRAGIHMKEYQEECPIIVIGGRTGSYLGEYMAGGKIIVLNLYSDKKPTGDYLATGMHGGEIYLRGKFDINSLSKNVKYSLCKAEDIALISAYIRDFAKVFGIDEETILKEDFTKIIPISNRPFKDVYTSK